MFNGDFIPPLITFAQGSLGFMCNFKFDDHPNILNLVLDKGQNDEIGIERRFRLKVNAGEGTSKNRMIFRGD